MVTDTVGKGGEVKLPHDVMTAAATQPGDGITFEVPEPNTIVLRILPPASHDKPAISPEACEHDPARTPVNYDELPILTLEEMLDRYRIEGPVDLKADREAMHDDMAKDVFGERPDRFPS